MTGKPTVPAIAALALGVGLALAADASDTPRSASLATLPDWPRVHSAHAPDPALEARVAALLAGMTLRQKVGQMTQAEIKSITPAQVREHYLGSVLNGGGSWPGKNKHAPLSDWVALADAYYEASMTTDMLVPVPIVWGTDAVHGHSNVFGATIYPHNIGLGAARDPELVAAIAAATARAVRATGIDWIFAPAVPVVQNARWGRTYESYSEDGALVRQYAHAATQGMQGRLDDDANAIASVKHFLGDGGTRNGKDQGLTVTPLSTLINLHGQGYYGAIEAGAQTVMASYNSWQDGEDGRNHGKMHGNRSLLTVALKEKMGFDGFIVSDWNAIGQLPGCTNSSCPQAINAGIDMMMVPDDWQAFIDNTVRQVEAGEIPMARIDDAVTRILRVKLRAGLFDGRKPSQNRHAGRIEAVQDRELARRAVRESLVLLKNDRGALPLRRGQRVLVLGASADSIPRQAGGWSLTWQGTDNSNADFPNGDSILAGLREALGVDKVTFREQAEGLDVSGYDAIVAVIGETPYAEGAGDISSIGTLSHSARQPGDLELLRSVSGRGKPVVTVLLSGRPLYVNDLLNLSDAFVAAWLPGTEGKGLADVMVAAARGKPRHDFRGRLSVSWPGTACPGPLARGPKGEAPLFAFGYGLAYGKPTTTGRLPEATLATGCGDATAIPVFNMRDEAGFRLHLAAAGAEQVLGDDLNATVEWPREAPLLRVRTVQVNTQQDAKETTWLGAASILARAQSSTNLKAMANRQGAVQFDVVPVVAPTAPVLLSMECGAGCAADLDLSRVLQGLEPGKRHTLAVPLACFAARGADLERVDVPWRISANRPFSASFTAIRIVTGAGTDGRTLACDEMN